MKVSGPKTEIIEFHPKLTADFERLNRQWIESLFEIVEADERVLNNPERYIIAPGGAIVFVRDIESAAILGTVALINHGDGSGELAKMAVDEQYQGYGYGRDLGEAIIDRARSLGMTTLYLETNSRLGPALGLYQRLGFTRTALHPASEYERADIRMVKSLL